MWGFFAFHFACKVGIRFLMIPIPAHFPDNIGRGCNLCESGQERPLYQVQKTKHTHIYSMCPVKSNHFCFIWTRGPFLFLIQQLLHLLLFFLSVASWSCIIFLSWFLSFTIIPCNRHHSIAVTVQRKCHSSSLFFPSIFSHPIPLSQSHLQQGVKGGQVAISWQTSFSSNKYLRKAEKNKISFKTIISYIVLPFLPHYAAVIKAPVPATTAEVTCQFSRTPQSQRYNLNAPSPPVSLLVVQPSSRATDWCAPHFLRPEATVWELKKLWEPLMKST